MRYPFFFSVLTALVLPAISQNTLAAERCPAVSDISNLSPLPDPFTFVNKRPVRTKDDWNCRRTEISGLVQRYSLGYLPTSKPKVEGKLVESAEANTVSLNVSVTEGEATIYFQAKIVVPAEGDGPFPAIISVGMYNSLAALPGVATIGFPNDLIAAQNGLDSRGKGLFYDLYGADHSAGALIAWTWGVGRLIDALEQVQEDSKINVKRLGVSGCSRNGKGAIVIGAFEPRIALTIPQEGGAGGAACWRIQDAQKRRGLNVQTATQIVTENTWFGKVFTDYVSRVDVLPFDQHLLSALIAPRALYTPENGVINWLGPEGTWGCQRAARTVWKALGVEDHLGFEQTGGVTSHNHCQLPAAHLPGLTAFVERFLMGKRVETSKYFRTDADFPEYSDKYWQEWATPRLR